jgi:ATP-dependent exoDNAse (exonuclease V) beta subunit
MTTATVNPPHTTTFTDEQLRAIEQRDGDLLLDAGAGSGKTSVLVERFARSVLEDGVDVAAILTITFTDKAAAELRDRIRAALKARGADDQARATEGAFISTIHGFCARVLRAHALQAGIDPAFKVLDGPDAERIADAAFDAALEQLAKASTAGGDLIAAYGPGPLRGAIVGAYRELRSRGQTSPQLPELKHTPPADQRELEAAAAAVARELGAIAAPSTKVIQALERLERVADLSAESWPSELDQLKLPGGNGAALSTATCVAYTEALERFKTAREHDVARGARDLLDQLLQGFATHYADHKRAASGVDFEDLELLTRDLFAADAALRERYQARFAQIMVDEFQDTNGIQLQLIELIANGNLFTVGDAQQSIYGFRHADVELFEQRGRLLEQLDRRATLQTNFRSRPEILEAINRAFPDNIPLTAGRPEPPGDEPLVELLIADKGADWRSEDEGLAAPWRRAEARALATRISELISNTAAKPAEIVVLTRATTDLRAYERALEEQGIPTYVIGGRGYWAHPQVIDIVAYLRALANPRDEEALYTVLTSPLVGMSTDSLVALAAAARAAGTHPWNVIREQQFGAWFAEERALSARAGVEELIERVLERTGYDLAILAMPGGQRRLANVRKLMRLGREYEAQSGPDLRGFLAFISAQRAGRGFAARESEAPVEGEALDAVRLMTIHRAKGLEFPIVCVADLGRVPWRRNELLRLGSDDRLGLLLARPGTAKARPALEHRALGDERLLAEAAEERRLFYVAMTRARERLILSGAGKLDAWPSLDPGRPPITWIAPALVPEIGEGASVEDADSPLVTLRVFRPQQLPDAATAVVRAPEDRDRPTVEPPAPLPAASAGSPVTTLSYSALQEYQRCGYRFYLERILGLPPVPAPSSGPVDAEAAGGKERGILVHALLEKLDFRRPAIGEDVDGLIEAFTKSELCARLGRARDVRREERFAFLHGELLIVGAFDVVAREGDRTLVVDYKSDRLDGTDPAELVEREYATQRLIYALAALRAGAREVEVVHVFLERAEAPVSAVFTDAAALEARLEQLTGSMLYVPSDEPCRRLCAGCPGEGGLCSWPLELTRREAIDQLF